MALIEDRDYVIVKRAAMFDGSRFNQQAGNLVATKTRLIFNVIDHADGMEKLSTVGENNNIKESWNETKEEFAKLKLFGQYADLVRQVGAECTSLQEFEGRVADMFAENIKSFNISNTDIMEVKSGIFAGLQFKLNDGRVWKFGPQGRGKIRRMIGK